MLVLVPSSVTMKSFVALTLCLTLVYCYDYRLEVRTRNKAHAGTDGRISARITGNKKKMVNFGDLDDKLKNDFKDGALDTFHVYSSVNIKKVSFVNKIHTFFCSM